MSSIESNKTDRERIALEAAWEIESLSKELVERGKNVNSETGDVFKEGYIIKNLAMRINELNIIIMSALDDGLVSVESLKLKLG